MLEGDKGVITYGTLDVWWLAKVVLCVGFSGRSVHFGNRG